MDRLDPGGRLPATFPRRAGDIPTAGDPRRYPGVNNEEYYKEGVFVGYRWYDEHNLHPAYPFGFGESYTTFKYRQLRVEPASGHSAVARVRFRVTKQATARAKPSRSSTWGFRRSGTCPNPPRSSRGSMRCDSSREGARR